MASDLWYQLPPDMQTWNTAVMENLNRKIPEASSYVSGISWSNLDPSTGDGDGLIAMLNGLASAPVTIRGNRLAPIDVVVTKTGSDVKFYPLSDFFLQKIYADNVIGKPVDNQTETDMDQEGPAYRVQHINTVNAVKYASIESAKNLFDTLTKSASVANWVSTNMPEAFLAIYNRANETEAEKTASMELPELIIAQKDGDRFFMNDEEVDSTTVGNFLKFAHATPENTTMLMSGIPFVYDMREKTAEIHIPTEQEITALDVDNAIFEDQTGLPAEKPDRYDLEHTGIFIATADLRSGERVHGLVLTSKCLDDGFNPNVFSNSQLRGAPATPVQTDPSIEGETRGEFGPSFLIRDSGENTVELFLSPDGYCVQNSIKTGPRTPITVKMLQDLSTISAPLVGMAGLFLHVDGYDHDVLFGRIGQITDVGSHRVFKVYNLVSHTETSVSSERYDFYEANGDRLPCLRAIDTTTTISPSGIVGRVVLNSDGNYVIEGDTVAERNVPYALMSKYASSYADALAILKTAKDNGQCTFEVKLAAENDNPDATKNRKGTKSGTDDESGAAQQPQNPSSESLAMQTPETAMSGGIQTGGRYVTDEPNFFGDISQGSMVSQATPSPVVANSPINPRDLENVVNLNDAQIMDAYMMSNLVSSDATSQETLNKTSESIVDALSRLSQLLFLVRQGSLSYLSEADVQVAMNKLTDVAQSLGINPMSIGTTA